MASKKPTPLTPEQTELILSRLEQALFFAHAAHACDDPHEIELVNKRFKATSAISHVGMILMRCAQDLGIPSTLLTAVSRSAEERVKERLNR